MNEWMNENLSLSLSLSLSLTLGKHSATWATLQLYESYFHQKLTVNICLFLFKCSNNNGLGAWQSQSSPHYFLVEILLSTAHIQKGTHSTSVQFNEPLYHC
jgi:hypothetical protein